MKLKPHPDTVHTLERINAMTLAREEALAANGRVIYTLAANVTVMMLDNADLFILDPNSDK